MFVLFSSKTPVAISVKDELVKSVMKVFEMKHPVIWTLNDTWSQKSLMKSLFSNGTFCQISIENHTEYLNRNIFHDIIIIANQEDNHENIIETVLEYSLTVVIFGLQKLPISTRIDKKVFIVQESTNEVYETYIINDHQINRKLGRFNNEVFAWEKNVEKDFVSRRSDFHGLTLSAMTEESGNDIYFDSNYREKATYFENNQTYLMTQFTHGKFYDIFLYLQKYLNFTTIFYKRKDDEWGYVYPQPDGSIRATGMVGDIYYGRADLVVAGLSLLYKRKLYIDYLTVIESQYDGLFIPSENKEVDFQFTILFQPFR